jgi:hypothetical protein
MSDAAGLRIFSRKAANVSGCVAATKGSSTAEDAMAARVAGVQSKRSTTQHKKAAHKRGAAGGVASPLRRSGGRRDGRSNRTVLQHNFARLRSRRRVLASFPLRGTARTRRASKGLGASGGLFVGGAPLAAPLGATLSEPARERDIIR